MPLSFSGIPKGFPRHLLLKVDYCCKLLNLLKWKTCQKLKETSPSTLSICETPPSPIAICHAYVIMVVCTRHHSKKSHGQNQLEVVTFLLQPGFSSSPSTSKLFKLCKYGIYKRFPEDSMITQRHRYILLIVIIIYYYHHDFEWHSLSWVLIYIMEQYLPWMHAD